MTLALAVTWITSTTVAGKVPLEPWRTRSCSSINTSKVWWHKEVRSIFITCERFARIASNLRFASSSPPKRGAQKKKRFRTVQFGNPATIRENQTIRANLRIDSRESGHLSARAAFLLAVPWQTIRKVLVRPLQTAPPAWQRSQSPPRLKKSTKSIRESLRGSLRGSWPTPKKSQKRVFGVKKNRWCLTRRVSKRLVFDSFWGVGELRPGGIATVVFFGDISCHALCDSRFGIDRVTKWWQCITKWLPI